jgi:hypothetical protein
VAVRERRDLRQVGDDEHLVAAGELGEAAADLDRRAAADPGVDLVEHEDGRAADLGEDHFDREHDAGELAA